MIVHQYGGRLGGPIVIPGLFNGRNKAFFFFNMEEFHQPTEASRTRTILHPRAQEGWFRYNATVGGVQQVREVNCPDARAAERPARDARPDHARAAGQHPDRGRHSGNHHGADEPEHAAVRLSERRHQQAAHADRTRRRQPLAEPPVERLLLVGPSGDHPGHPQQHRRAVPGLRRCSAYPPSYRTVGSTSLRSTLSSTLVNELRGGWQWSPLDFSSNVTREMFAQQGGFGWDFGTANTR